MQEYIIITRPAEKEGKHTITLMDGKILQAGLRKDVETLEDYIQNLECTLKSMEVNGEDRFNTHYYFVDGAIRLNHYWKDRPLDIRPLKPEANLHGSVNYHAKAVDILYQFDKKLKEMFPEAEYKLKVKYHACCVMQPRLIFKMYNTKPILRAFPEFKLADKIDETKYDVNVIPPELKYEDDYTDHYYDYYDCPRCDNSPCWGRYREEKPEEDPHDEFYEQKTPKRSRGSPRAHCFGTRIKEYPAETELVEMGYWKLSTEELFSRIENPRKSDDLTLLIDERTSRIFSGKVKILLTDKPIGFNELGDILVPDIEAGKKLAELEKRGLIKGYHAKQEA